MTPRPDVSFRISRPVTVDFPEVESVRYRAGFEDWNDPGAFVVQLEEATGYAWDRTAVAWSPIARFDHLRPHDVFDPDEGLHVDVYRRWTPDDSYETVSLEGHLRGRDPEALFYYLQEGLEESANVEVLLQYYVGQRRSIEPDDITLPGLS